MGVFLTVATNLLNSTKKNVIVCLNIIIIIKWDQIIL